MKLYKSLFKLILIYNSVTWGLTKNEEETLTSFHRQQLRRVLNAKYPANISNVKLYKQTGEDVLSLEILQIKWKLFGHVLRSYPDTPAQKAMNYYVMLLLLLGIVLVYCLVLAVCAFISFD